MSNFKKNLFSVYSINILNGIFGVLFIPLSLQFLGAEGYGLFSIYGVLASFIVLLDLGIGRNLQRLLVSDNDNESRRSHLQNALGIYLLIALFLLLLLPVFLVFVPKYLFTVEQKNLESLRLIIFFSVIEYLIAIPVVIRQSICFSNERFDRYAIFNFISGITRYTLMFTGVLLFSSPIILVGLLVSRRFVDLFTSKLILGDTPTGAWKPKITYKEFRSIFNHSAGISLGHALQSIVISVGSILVNKYFGLEGLGKYRVAFDLSSKIWIVSNGIGLVVFPKFVKNITKSKENEMFFSKLYRYMNVSWVGFNGASVVGILAAPFLFKSIGSQDSVILSLFVLLLPGVCLNAHANLSYELLQASTKYRLIAFITAISILILLGCFYILKPLLGIYAIGLAWGVSQVVYSVLADFGGLIILNFPREKVMKMFVLRGATLMPTLIVLAVYFEYL